MSKNNSSKSAITDIKKTFQDATETGIKYIEESARAAGRRAGWDVTVARTIKRLLGSKER